MKNMMILLLTFLFSFSCTKKESSNNDCGCNATNFTVVTNQKGILVDTNNTWYLVNSSTAFPAFTGFICNVDSSLVKKFTDTATTDSIPVLFSGRRSQLCTSDSLHQTTPADYYAFNIKIDSLKNY